MIGLGRIGMFLGVTALGLSLSTASCGGGGSATPDGSTGTAGTGGTVGSMTPMAACTALASAICTRDNMCNARGATAQDVTDCTTAQKVAYGCDRAGATSAGFNQCLQDVQTLSCSSLFPAPDNFPMLPGACTDPINAIPFSDAQSACSLIGQSFCDRVFSCANVAAPSSTENTNCLQVYFDNLGCAYATGIGTTVAQCKTEIGMIPCPSDGGTAADADGGAAGDGSSPIPSCETAIVYAP